MSVVRRCLDMASLFEAEILTELMLRYWQHPLADNREYRNDLLEAATQALQEAADGGRLLDSLSPEKTNLVAAIWYAEWAALRVSEAEDPADIHERRKQWLAAWNEPSRRVSPTIFFDATSFCWPRSSCRRCLRFPSETWYALQHRPSHRKKTGCPDTYYARLKLRPSLNHGSCRNARQFPRLNLVKAATVDPPLPTEFVARDAPQEFMHADGPVRVLAEHGREAPLWVQHEVKIRSDGLGAVVDETEGLLFVRTTAHIRCRGTELGRASPACTTGCASRRDNRPGFPPRWRFASIPTTPGDVARQHDREGRSR